MSVWAFEKYVGSDLKNPYEHIFLPRKGTCLLDCHIAAWDESNEHRCRGVEPFVPKETATDKSDDLCSICGDGGALICCEKCPSTFHPHCMSIKNVPQDGGYVLTVFANFVSLVLTLLSLPFAMLLQKDLTTLIEEAESDARDGSIDQQANNQNAQEPQDQEAVIRRPNIDLNLKKKKKIN
ncbi:increased DNA methylation 1-like [Senna tora]|uniref:Increased DNA methylation 1-like n=1 Tax=Senna tora TaxID=362788 RepID=A0A834TXB8_9FABA|nr:increased DNA methylation 1-like [Senna tora]